MAKAIDDEHAKQLGLEKEAVDKLGEKYDDLIEFFVLLALNTNISRQRKLTMASQKLAQYKRFNSAFSQSTGRKAYELGKNIAYRDVRAPYKKLTTAQESELANLVRQLNLDLDSRLGVYHQNFKKLTYKVDISQLRESKLGFTNATERRLLNGGRTSRREILFMDSKGRRISNRAIMSVGPGDMIWDMMGSGQRSIYLSLGITHALHVSVIDDRTTDICLSLHKKVRDLRRDPIPPMHKRCRSKIRAINPQTGEVFSK